MNNQPTPQTDSWRTIAIMALALIGLSLMAGAFWYHQTWDNKVIQTAKLEAENSTILSIAQGQTMSGNFLVFNYQTNQTEVWTYNELCNIKSGGNGQ